MKKKTISEIAIKYLIENDMDHIGYGWLTQLHDIYNEWIEQYPNKETPHAIDVWNRVLNALDNDPDNWEKRYFKANTDRIGFYEG